MVTAPLVAIKGILRKVIWLKHRLDWYKCKLYCKFKYGFYFYFTALKDSNGFYIINGKFTIDPPGAYKFAGTTINYNRTKYRETIEIEGPTAHALHLMVRQSRDYG